MRATGTIGPGWWLQICRDLNWSQFNPAVAAVSGGPEVFTRKLPEVPNADLVDLLLDADEPTRKLLLFQALRVGDLKKSEAEKLMSQVVRLERAAMSRRPSVKAA
jgi:hypothetical protein